MMPKNETHLGSRERPDDGKAGAKIANAEFWRSGLLESREGQPKRCLANVMHVLTLHPDWSGVLAFDAFGIAVITQKQPPARALDMPDNYRVGDWTDEDSVRTAAWFASKATGGLSVAQAAWRFIDL